MDVDFETTSCMHTEDKYILQNNVETIEVTYQVIKEMKPAISVFKFNVKLTVKFSRAGAASTINMVQFRSHSGKI